MTFVERCILILYLLILVRQISSVPIIRNDHQDHQHHRENIGHSHPNPRSSDTEHGFPQPQTFHHPVPGQVNNGENSRFKRNTPPPVNQQQFPHPPPLPPQHQQKTRVPGEGMETGSRVNQHHRPPSINSDQRHQQHPHNHHHQPPVESEKQFHHHSPGPHHHHQPPIHNSQPPVNNNHGPPVGRNHNHCQNGNCRPNGERKNVQAHPTQGEPPHYRVKRDLQNDQNQIRKQQMDQVSEMQSLPQQQLTLPIKVNKIHTMKLVYPDEFGQDQIIDIALTIPTNTINNHDYIDNNDSYDYNDSNDKTKSTALLIIEFDFTDPEEALVETEENEIQEEDEK